MPLKLHDFIKKQINIRKPLVNFSLVLLKCTEIECIEYLSTPIYSANKTDI